MELLSKFVEVIDYKQIESTSFVKPVLCGRDVILKKYSLAGQKATSYLFNNEDSIIECLVEYAKANCQCIKVNEFDSLDTIASKINDSVFCQLSRGGCNTVLCSPDFAKKHPLFNKDLVELIISDKMPNDSAIGNYRSKNELDKGFVIALNKDTSTASFFKAADFLTFIS